MNILLKASIIILSPFAKGSMSTFVEKVPDGGVTFPPAILVVELVATFQRILITVLVFNLSWCIYKNGID